MAEYEAAVNQRDTQALAAMFAPDADFIFFDGPRIVGQDSIRAAHEGISKWPRSKRFTLEVTSIRFLASDVALVETLAH